MITIKGVKEGSNYQSWAFRIWIFFCRCLWSTASHSSWMARQTDRHSCGCMQNKTLAVAVRYPAGIPLAGLWRTKSEQLMSWLRCILLTSYIQLRRHYCKCPWILILLSLTSLSANHPSEVPSVLTLVYEMWAFTSDRSTNQFIDCHEATFGQICPCQHCLIHTICGFIFFVLCLLSALCWFLAWITLPSWRWRQYMFLQKVGCVTS